MKDEEDANLNSDAGEINPDALEEVFGDVVISTEDEEVEIIVKKTKKQNTFGDEEADELYDEEEDEDDIDIAFQANDEKYW